MTDAYPQEKASSPYETQVERKCKHHFNESAGGIVHQGRFYYCEHAGVKEGIAEGAGIRNANADVLYQSGGEGIEPNPPEKIGEGQDSAFQAWSGFVNEDL